MLTGRTDFLGKLSNARTPSSAELQDCDAVRNYWCRIQVIMAVRALLIQTDAELLLSQANSKQLRTAVDEKYAPNQPSHIWNLTRRCWANGPRFISDSGRNAAVGLNGKLPKIPMAWIRPQLISGASSNITDVAPVIDQPNPPSRVNVVPVTGAPAPIDPSSNHPPNVKIVPLTSAPAPVDLSEGSSCAIPGRVPLPFKRYNLRPAGMSSLDQTGLLYADWIFLSARDNSVASDDRTIPVIMPPSQNTINTEELAASLRLEFGNFDLSRIPPGFSWPIKMVGQQSETSSDA